jgi:hypothetical protein
MKAGGTYPAARQRTLWLVLLLAAILCRGFIADGFMPDFSAAKKTAWAPRMVICYGGMDAGRSPAAPHQDQNRHRHDTAPCPYMALASHTPVAPVVIASSAPDALPFRAPAPARFVLSRYKTGTAARAPPAVS